MVWKVVYCLETMVGEENSSSTVWLEQQGVGKECDWLYAIEDSKLLFYCFTCK